jgi:hypothetical protein
MGLGKTRSRQRADRAAGNDRRDARLPGAQASDNRRLTRTA